MAPKKSEKEQKASLLGLLTAQFFGAFNDNAWKVMLFTLATRPLLEGHALSAFETSSQLIATLSLLVFLVPMMLFSLPAGAFADQMSKKSLIIATKVAELLFMVAATFSLYFAPTHLIFPFVLLALMGAQSALFGPAKYGILPEILPREKLSRGNGLLEMWTMIAIIAGTGLGPALLAADHAGLRPSWTWLGALWLTLLSVVGLAGTSLISSVPPARRQSQGMVNSMSEAWSAIQKDHVLWLAILGSVTYWSMTSLLGQNVLVYAKLLVRDIEKGELLQGIPAASYGMGIALGALLSGRLSGNHIEYGFIPLGTIGFALSSLLLGIVQPNMMGTILLLLWMGLSSGLLIVPIHAIVQSKAPSEQRGSIIALGNFLDIVGMILGSLIAAAMALLGIDLQAMLIASAFLVVCATIWAIRILPKALVRLCFIILTRTAYRLKIVDFDNFPKEGASLLVANHVSIIDALFIMAAVDRPVRFIISDYYYRLWYIYPFAKLMEAIPVSNTANARMVLQGLRQAGEALDNGEIVCIFPEGQISHTGKMLPFKRGIEIIAKGRSSPIVPIHLSNVWGSIFSFRKGRFFRKWPERSPYSLTITFGKPLPATTPLSKLRCVMQEMECEAWLARKQEQHPIYHQWIDYARRCPWQLTLADKEKKWPAWKTATFAIAIARKLKGYCVEGYSAVGIAIPSSIPAALANLATTLSGRAVINVPCAPCHREEIEHIFAQAQLKVVITSKFFADTAASLPTNVQQIALETLMEKISRVDKLLAFVIAFFAPLPLLEKFCDNKKEPDGDDPLAVIFTSGSTGKSKGVILSHFNVASNVEALSQVIPYLGNKKNLLACLPFSHSLGYLLLWLGLNHRMGVILHSNPLDGQTIGELAKREEIKLMISTPPLLRRYIKTVPPDQFGSLQYVMSGSEKLSPRLAEAFEQRFGISPVEGYDATECSPLIATSTLNVRRAGIYQVGTLPGSVGQTIPGVIAKVIHPETYEELPFDSQGLLLVKGPNIMQGYLQEETPTQHALHQGWYMTGDIATIDHNGFITLIDKAKRMSKMGNSLVSHSKIEELLHRAAGSDEPLFAVTAICYEKEEKLAILHTLEPSTLKEILQKQREQGDPLALFSSHFIKVEQLPLLALGKSDLQRAKTIAALHWKTNPSNISK